MMFPGLIEVSCGRPASSAATSLTFPAAPSGMKNWEYHATTWPFGSSPAWRSTSVGGPLGSQPCSSARIHCKIGRASCREGVEVAEVVVAVVGNDVGELLLMRSHGESDGR